MVRRILRYAFNTAMLAVIGWCVWSLVVDGRQLRELRAEQSHLEKLVGTLEVTDASQIAVRCIEHSAPFEFSWRVYVPAGIDLSTQHSMVGGGGGSHFSGAATEPLQQACSPAPARGTRAIHHVPGTPQRLERQLPA